MALWPVLEDYSFSRPSRLLDQRFGSSLSSEDFLEPITRDIIRSFAGYLRPWRSLSSQTDVGSTLKFENDKFEINLDVEQFKPEEISVKVSGENTITIEGKHEEKQDEYGFISRQFSRRYVLPKNCDMEKLESKLSSDGVLTISAPAPQKNPVEYKEVKVLQTGEPAKQNEKKSEE